MPINNHVSKPIVIIEKKHFLPKSRRTINGGYAKAKGRGGGNTKNKCVAEVHNNKK